MTEFVLSLVARTHSQSGTPLAVGNIIEHPFRSGHAWRVMEIDEKADRIVLAEAKDLPVRKPGRASLPETGKE